MIWFWRLEITCRFIFVLLFFLILPSSILSQGISYASEAKERPKIGLVLGGGGAKGSAHIGVLKVLEELKIPIDYIAGTSMGAVVGSLYAAGSSAAECEKILTTVDWDDLFRDNPPRDDISFRRKQEDFTYMARAAVGIKDGKIRLPKAFIAGQKIGVFFESLLLPVAGITDFDKLPIPYRAVAADLETGEMVVLKSGRLADAAKASMSVPGVFPPAEVQGRYLTDGGIVRNLPVDIVRNMGADVLIVVDVGKPLPKREDLGSPFAIMNQMIGIMINQNVQAQIESLGEEDVFIRPDLGTIESADFQRGKEAVERGEEAARKQTDSLRRYSVSEQEYAVFAARHRMPEVSTVHIASVTVQSDGLINIPKESVESRLEIKAGDVLTKEELQKRVSLVYGIGDFERVDLDLNPRGDAHDVVLRPVEKSWGPNYVKFGLNLETNFASGSSYNILVDHTRRWINRLGAEWKTLVQVGSNMAAFSEFYQPLDQSHSYFVAPYIRADQRFVDVYRGRDIVAEYRAREFDWGFDFGLEPLSYGELRVGYVGGLFKPKLQTGELAISDETVNKGGLRMRLIVDQLDNVNFPRKGFIARANFYAARSELGADDEYNRLDITAGKAFTYKKFTILGSVRFGTYLGKHLPFYDEFTLGGFLSLSGLASDQLRGERVGLGRLITYWQARKSIIGDLYLGGSIETGNAWKKDEDMRFDSLRLAGSAFVGFDSLFGPLYLAYGHADQGFNAVYLYLGRTF
ncbi:MAG: patatin-like phospholipase family protein [Nitrospirota bacterium]